jgi:hypothetical protein
MSFTRVAHLPTIKAVYDSREFLKKSYLTGETVLHFHETLRNYVRNRKSKTSCKEYKTRTDIFKHTDTHFCKG